MRVGIGQINIIWEDKIQNMKKVQSYLMEAKEKEVDIVFFPEMTLTGFSMEVERTQDVQWGDTIEQFKTVCSEIGIAAGFGWVEGSTHEKAKNHYAIVDEQGNLLSDYTKIHPFTYGGEGNCFTGGEQIVSCKYKGHKISTAICYDLRFPELFRIMDLDSSLVVIPANWPAKRREHWQCLLQARAIENQVYVVGVNCVGQMDTLYYSGDSALYSPLGEKLISLSEEEGLLIYDVPNDIQKYRDEFPVRKDQKIEIRKLHNDNN